MVDSIHDRLERFWRGHPGLLLAVTIVTAMLTTLLLLVNSQDHAILYKAF
jgi:hypothetical protein